MTTDKFDAVVIGGGMSGLPLALKLGHKGMKVALVERAELGGTCLNRGCIPTKAMIASAKVAHQARQAATWGVMTGDVRVDVGRVVDRKDELVSGIRSGANRNVDGNQNVTLLRGHARFTSDQTLDVDGQEIETQRAFINTGTRNVVPRIPGVDHVPFLDSTSALDLRELPERLIVIGGGFIGVEYAQMFARFGSHVTLVQRPEQLLPSEDEDVARALEEALRAEGLEVLTGTDTVWLQGEQGNLRVTVVQEGQERELHGTHLLIAAGRLPNTQDLGIHTTSVKLADLGFVRVNDRLETNALGIWALGDVRGGPMFTHTARDDARIVYENITKNANLSITGRAVPYAVFSDPQLGRVGLTEKAARAAGFKVKVGVYEGRKVAKARALGEEAGLIKVVADADTDRLLGAAVLLAQGAEVVHELTAAVHLGARYTDLEGMLHIHPTLAEGLSSALGGVHYEEGI